MQIVVPSDSKSLDERVLLKCTRITAHTSEDPHSWHSSYESEGRRGLHAIHSAQLILRESQRVQPELRKQWVQRHASLAAGVDYADAATAQYDRTDDNGAEQLMGIMPVESALGLLGLWMQHHSRFEVPDDQLGPITTSSETLRWVASRGALPAGWGYINACSAASASIGDRPRDLGLSILTRMSRALRARNEIHLYLWGAKGSSPYEELPFWFDTYLLLLSAAYDSLARATYLIYDLGHNPVGQNWNKLKEKEEYESRGVVGFA